MNWETVVNIVESLKANTPPPSGPYIGFVTGAPKAINDSRRAGVRFVLEIAEGAFRGRRVTIELVTELKVGGNRARMLSDHQALGAWITALGVESAETPTELIAKLRDTALGKRVEFELDCHRWKNRLDVYLVGVRLAP
jgi:hypothetical protein